MPQLSNTDRSVSPPLLAIPREYNAAHDLLESNLRAGRAAKIAYIDDRGRWTYGELADRCRRFAQALRRMGIQPEQRVLLCLQDTIDFPTAFLGCIWAGIIPVAINTQLKTGDYEHMLRDSRARALVVSHALSAQFAPLISAHRASGDAVRRGAHPVCFDVGFRATGGVSIAVARLYLGG
jgi:benzoate-CoA ligase